MMQPETKINRHEWLKQAYASNLTWGAKHVAVALWGFANESGYCWPNISDIQLRIGMRSDSRISQHLKVLIYSGWVLRGTQQATNGYQSNNYELLIPTHVGINSPNTLSVSGVQTPETLKKRTLELAPTEVGAQLENGDLGPTTVGPGYSDSPDLDWPGVDPRDPPSWAVGPRCT